MGEVLEIPDTSAIDRIISNYTDDLPSEMDYTITLTCTYGEPLHIDVKYTFTISTKVPTFKWVFHTMDWMRQYPQKQGVQIQFIYTREQKSVSIDQIHFVR